MPRVDNCAYETADLRQDLSPDIVAFRYPFRYPGVRTQNRGNCLAAWRKAFCVTYPTEEWIVKRPSHPVIPAKGAFQELDATQRRGRQARKACRSPSFPRRRESSGHKTGYGRLLLDSRLRGNDGRGEMNKHFRLHLHFWKAPKAGIQRGDTHDERHFLDSRLRGNDGAGERAYCQAWVLASRRCPCGLHAKGLNSYESKKDHSRFVFGSPVFSSDSCLLTPEFLYICSAALGRIAALQDAQT